MCYLSIFEINNNRPCILFDTRPVDAEFSLWGYYLSDKLEFIEQNMLLCSYVAWYPPEGYFLVAEQESTQRSQHRGGIESIAPAIEAIRPYVPHPARTRRLPSTLTTEKRETYGLADGVGSALAALPVWETRYFGQKIGTFSA